MYIISVGNENFMRNVTTFTIYTLFDTFDVSPHSEIVVTHGGLKTRDSKTQEKARMESSNCRKRVIDQCAGRRPQIVDRITKAKAPPKKWRRRTLDHKNAVAVASWWSLHGEDQSCVTVASFHWTTVERRISQRLKSTARDCGVGVAWIGRQSKLMPSFVHWTFNGGKSDVVATGVDCATDIVRDLSEICRVGCSSSGSTLTTTVNDL